MVVGESVNRTLLSLRLLTIICVLKFMQLQCLSLCSRKPFLPTKRVNTMYYTIMLDDLMVQELFQVQFGELKRVQIFKI